MYRVLFFPSYLYINNSNCRRQGTANNYTISRHNSRLQGTAVFRQTGQAGARGHMEMGTLRQTDNRYPIISLKLKELELGACQGFKLNNEVFTL